MVFSRSQWRLILHPPKRGAWNMAVDEAILEAVGRAEALPTLRLYAWSPPCLSLGYAQSLGDVDQEALATLGWDIVRRPTGGRAILHTDELTYSVIGPPDDPRLSNGVLESYRNLSRALLRGLTTLGINAESVEINPQTGANETSKESKKTPNPICFEVPSNFEITLNGKKLIGSAQARRKEGVLQHGTLPLHGDHTRIIQALRFSDENTRQRARTRLLERATTVQLGTGRELEWERAAESIVKAFQTELSLDFIPGELSSSEVARARELENVKYSNLDWTGRS
ncbi:MAG: lipoate--protein ligase family protein [Anaerolineales bacterium]|jgi:lipoate-protein ligase A|nr:lipoate--protein ligase family protein [Anaerolineales bacterium]